MDHHHGNGSKEDFTLLNLSRSSSSSTEELFRPDSRNLPKRKRRTKRRSGGGGSSTASRQSDPLSKQPAITPNIPSPNVLYTILIFSLCWIATLTWLVFSLRNQLADVVVGVEGASSITRPLPERVDVLNTTLLKLNASLTEAVETENTTLTRLTQLEKSMNGKPDNWADCRKEIADLGSSLGSKVKDLENEVQLLKEKLKSVRPVEDGPPPMKKEDTQD